MNTITPKPASSSRDLRTPAPAGQTLSALALCSLWLKEFLALNPNLPPGGSGQPSPSVGTVPPLAQPQSPASLHLCAFVLKSFPGGLDYCTISASFLRHVPPWPVPNACRSLVRSSAFRRSGPRRRGTPSGRPLGRCLRDNPFVVNPGAQPSTLNQLAARAEKVVPKSAKRCQKVPKRAKLPRSSHFGLRPSSFVCQIPALPGQHRNWVKKR